MNFSLYFQITIPLWSSRVEIVEVLVTQFYITELCGTCFIMMRSQEHRVHCVCVRERERQRQKERHCLRGVSESLL